MDITHLLKSVETTLLQFKWQKELIYILKALMVIFIISMLAEQIYYLNNSAADSNKSISLSPKNTISEKTTLAKQKINSIADFHLFGDNQQSQASNSDDSIQLHGIFYTGLLGDKARAAIAFSQYPEKIYEVGNSLPDGSTIAGITTTHVTILRNGTYKDYYIKWDEVSSIKNNLNKEPSLINKNSMPAYPEIKNNYMQQFIDAKKHDNEESQDGK